MNKSPNQERCDDPSCHVANIPGHSHTQNHSTMEGVESVVRKYYGYQNIINNEEATVQASIDELNALLAKERESAERRVREIAEQVIQDERYSGAPHAINELLKRLSLQDPIT